MRVVLWSVPKGIVIFISLVAFVRANELTGSVSLEGRYFTQEPFYPEQTDSDVSVMAEMEYFTNWSSNSGIEHSLIFKPFARLDSADDERSHVDIRELLWMVRKDNVVMKAGFGKEFWGATEFYHLVDIINQTDIVESPDGEEKLGQPMIALSVQTDWGETEFFLLPGFRERDFAGAEGRFRTFPPIHSDQTLYESSEKKEHIDWAIRWSHTIDRFDIGLSYFNGTSRDPLLLLDQTTRSQPTLIPFYSQIAQIGLDSQATFGNWLWKLEVIHRRRRGSDYYGGTGGFEYSFIGILNSRSDLGLVLEYMYDERGNQANHFQQNDIGLGLRLALNDEQSSEMLLGLIQDRNSEAQVWSVEAKRRIRDGWRLDVEGVVFRKAPQDDVLQGLQQDDYVSVKFNRFF